MTPNSAARMRTSSPRILIAKPGLDGHDRGAKYVARILSDAGFQVHYTGIRRTPEEIVDQAIALEVDAVGLSLLSGAHNLLFPRVIADLRQRGHEEILVFGGGVIPANDVAHLRSVGVAAVFTPGASARDIVNTLRALLAQQADATADCVEVSR